MALDTRLRSALLLIAVVQGFAQAPSEEPIDSLRSMLKSLNIPFQEDNPTAFKLMLGGSPATLKVSKADLALSYTVSSHPSGDKINQWNAGHRFTRAYLDSTGAPHLDSDLDTTHGMSQATLQAFITNFGKAAGQFTSEFANAKAGSKTKVALPYGGFSLSVDMTQWSSPDNRGGPMLFTQLHGDGYAMVINNPIPVTDGLEGLRKAILANAKNNIPDLKVTYEGKRKLGNREVLVLGMEGTVSGVSLRYLDNAYSGAAGTITILTYSSPKTFDKNRPLFEDFLDGIEINEAAESATAAIDGNLSLNEGKAELVFDKTKWKVINSRPGQYILSYSGDELYAQVIAEEAIVPNETIMNVGLGNIKAQDPAAKVMFRGKKTVNQLELGQMNVAATVRGMALSYRNYYYTGTIGTIQIMTWAGIDLSKKYEKQVDELLGGFHVR